jgi:hypothetical protein
MIERILRELVEADRPHAHSRTIKMSDGRATSYVIRVAPINSITEIEAQGFNVEIL